MSNDFYMPPLDRMPHVTRHVHRRDSSEQLLPSS
jgi:hypothetical protein